MQKLVKVVLYPCSGQKEFRPKNHKYRVDEWYERDGLTYNDRSSSIYFDTPDDAQRHYEPPLTAATGHFTRADYVVSGDSYTADTVTANFVVTGSHGFCPECSAYLREQRILTYMREHNCSRDEAERYENNIDAWVKSVIAKRSR